MVMLKLISYSPLAYYIFLQVKSAATFMGLHLVMRVIAFLKEDNLFLTSLSSILATTSLT